MGSGIPHSSLGACRPSSLTTEPSPQSKVKGTRGGDASHPLVLEPTLKSLWLDVPTLPLRHHNFSGLDEAWSFSPQFHVKLESLVTIYCPLNSKACGIPWLSFSILCCTVLGTECPSFLGNCDQQYGCYHREIDSPGPFRLLLVAKSISSLLQWLLLFVNQICKSLERQPDTGARKRFLKVYLLKFNISLVCCPAAPFPCIAQENLTYIHTRIHTHCIHKHPQLVTTPNANQQNA